MHEFHKIKLRSEKPKIIVNSYNPNNNSITTEKQQEQQQKPSFFQRLFQKKNKKEEKKTEIKNDEIINTLQQPPIELLPFTNKKIKFISYNMYHLIYVTTDNEMYGMGFNSFGQLGCGDFIEKNTFTKIDFNGQIKFILCLYFVTVLINQCNEVFVCGNINMFKEYIQDKNLMKSENFIKTNIKLNELNGSIKFLRGKSNYLFFVTEKSIYGIGCNSYGNLGLKCPEDDYLETNITKIMDNEIIDLQCGWAHSVILDKNGDVFVTGRNDDGQLGTGDKKHRIGFTKINLPFKVKKINCCNCTTLILNDLNELYITGFNFIQEKTFNSFTKIVVDQSLQNQEDEIIDLFPSFGHYLLFITKRNNIFVIGENKNELLGIDYSLCKNDTNLDKFMKLDWFTTNRKFIFPILLENRIYLFTSNYKVNELEKENDLGSNCFQKAKQKQLCDCILVCV